MGPAVAGGEGGSYITQFDFCFVNEWQRRTERESKAHQDHSKQLQTWLESSAVEELWVFN